MKKVGKVRVFPKFVFKNELAFNNPPLLPNNPSLLQNNPPLLRNKAPLLRNKAPLSVTTRASCHTLQNVRGHQNSLTSNLWENSSISPSLILQSDAIDFQFFMFCVTSSMMPYAVSLSSRYN